jgi:hypothetical protein
LRLHDDDVAVVDHGVDHRVAAHAQGVEVIALGLEHLAADDDGVFLVIGGKDVVDGGQGRGAGADVAPQGYADDEALDRVAQRAGGTANRLADAVGDTAGLIRQAQAARDVGVAVEITLSLRACRGCS